MHSHQDTIYAPASGYLQKSGIIVVRISGPKVLQTLHALGCAKSIKPRYATLTNIYHPTTKALIDNCIIVYYKSPHSFTGEDVAEINIHGGKAILKLLLSALSSLQGLRFAEPGEFSMRAVINQKLDLIQAEGLAYLIDAETSHQQEAALEQLTGEASKVYESYRSQLIEIMALLEAHIDFPEDDLPNDLVTKVCAQVKSLNSGIQQYLKDNHAGERLRDGMLLAIIGPTNAGKSSLMNKLAKRDVAIVSSIAGTTRDVIEVHLEINGYPIILADTAGIRESGEEIENEGIKRTLDKANQADCKLIVLDATTAPDKNILKLIDENSIVVLNKIDIARPKQSILNNRKCILSSMRDDTGIDEIMAALKEFTDKFFRTASSSSLITNHRQRELLAKCSECLKSLSFDKGVEFAAEDLRSAATYLGRITGKIDVESMLDVIFSSFCIGK